MFEPVETVDDFYDGPRAGRATAFGRPCSYETLRWNERHDPDEERYLLRFTDDRHPQTLVATAVFRALPGQPELSRGAIRKLEAEWVVANVPPN